MVISIFLLSTFFAGVLFIGKVWGKVRPMVEIEKDGTTYHAGVSHSYKEGMIPIAQADLEEGSTLAIGENAFVGLSNKSTQKFKFGELGNTKPAIDEEILAANDKLADKIEKRST